MTDSLHTWLDERERIYKSNPEVITEFEWMDDRGEAYPKLVRGVRKVLDLHRRATDLFEPSEFCAACSTDQRTAAYPCPTVRKLQEAINDDE